MKTKTAAIEKLIESLDTQSDKAADAIIKKLVAHGKASVPPLIRVAENLELPRIRKWAIHALGEFKNPRARSILIGALKDPRMTVKLHAIRGLRNQGRSLDGKMLVPLLKDESGGIRVNAIDAIASLNYSGAGKNLVAMLNDDQWYVRQHAAAALDVLGETKALPVLKKAIKTERRNAVIAALERAIESLA